MHCDRERLISVTRGNLLTHPSGDARDSITFVIASDPGPGTVLCSTRGEVYTLPTELARELALRIVEIAGREKPTLVVGRVTPATEPEAAHQSDG